MSKSQTSLLLALAKKLDKKENSKELAIKSLNSAGIMTKRGELTKHFSNLDRALSFVK